ncbi:MAG: right-handed parallel beta-helix repeat-containing protein [Holophaga sp.]|jgi:parallel beta-helix repeat protein
MSLFRIPWILALAAICGSATASPAGPTENTGLVPQVARVAPGAVQAFRAAFPDPVNPSLIWAVDAVPGGDSRTGTLSRSGTTIRYSAPAQAGAHLVTAAVGGRTLAWAAVLVGRPPAADPAPGGVNVRDAPYLAKGDGVADDTGAIQRAVDAVAGTGGAVLVPAGTYRVNTIANSNRGLVLGGRMTLAMAPGAVLKAIPNASGNYTLVSVAGASDVTVLGGTLLGDRGAHAGTAGEWGMGLSVQGSRRVTVAGVSARECWGDGFYISGSAEVTFDSVLAVHNRRNGLSITSCRSVTVRGSVFRDSRGTAPQDGLDVEPNPGETVSGALITGCLFAGNAGNGLEDGVPDLSLGRAFVTQVSIDANAFIGNGQASAEGAEAMAVRISNCPGTQVTRNVVLDNAGRGIYLRFNADGSLVSGNTVVLTAGDGIAQAACRDNRITANQVLRNTGHGILSTNCTGGTVSGNTVAGNGMSP